ncbi:MULTISPECIES: hypothetical protein [unclassified Mesorhizobium]|uniref:hypothetical protein n=1 Tax=unclassified Mesorhizobium TaxID=325217 RepID=UPI00112C627C|nr:MULTISPECIES: hypothetical protein [unclassified Mesorhizobium]TPK42653.1 hypothetical protein FJ550_29805 [Mesorhizobium sp. B2-5-2]TPL26773.1 hypothetical protein FJ946_13125 [Mesorhizobium sp. B2-4-7]TPL40551.1 hypothetical protein FJ961_17425 [Mesorhizobium sp. B2-4-5]TPM76825.1 hypothetical protein FJ968_03655 [Mesorhizobium sp. B2-1-6]TPN72488.1 hypothetical protein FJ985_29310 [Mesorhizobium sp. B1-1-2]
MRLAIALLCRAHFGLACWHERRARDLLAEIRLRRMVADSSNLSKEPQFRENAGRVLLASIVGMAIAGIWLWISARASR